MNIEQFNIQDSLRSFGELAGPKVQEITSQLAAKTLEQAQDLSKKIVKGINKRPMILFGFAGLVVAGVALHYVRQAKNEVVAKATP